MVSVVDIRRDPSDFCPGGSSQKRGGGVMSSYGGPPYLERVGTRVDNRGLTKKVLVLQPGWVGR